MVEAVTEGVLTMKLKEIPIAVVAASQLHHKYEEFGKELCEKLFKSFMSTPPLEMAKRRVCLRFFVECQLAEVWDPACNSPLEMVTDLCNKSVSEDVVLSNVQVLANF